MKIKPYISVPLCILFTAVLISGCKTDLEQQQALPSKKSDAFSLLSKRQQMVKQQIIDRGITDEKITNAFLKVERHLFVPKEYVNKAYEDRPLPIDEGQTISQPYIVAYMTEVLDLSRSDKVLEIGTGSGYQAAILGELSNHVYTIEINEPLGTRATKLLKDLGYSNVKVKIGDGYKGWEEYAPFDAIVVTCSPTHIPEPLQEQLKEGGRMIIPVGQAYHQKLIYMKKINNELKKQSELPVMFVPMVDPEGKPY